MPSLDLYKKMKGSNTLGQARIAQANMITEATWNEDLSQRIAYQFDCYHDPNPRWLKNMKPTKDMIPLDIKFIRHTSQTMDKDSVTFHMQLRPSQQMNVPYYQRYIDSYENTWPLGLYLLIPDSKGIYNRWLVVAEADGNDIQFPTYELLRCDYTFQYIIDGKKMEVAGVLRSQNSYNSGVWTDYKVTSVKFEAALHGDV